MFRLAEIVPNDTRHLWLKIAPKEQHSAWEQAQSHSNPIACYNAYINRLCLSHLTNWLESYFCEQASVPTISISPTMETLPSIWEVVNGAAIQIGEARVVLVPTETIDLDELRVPQEWVDIPNWVADYYLAVQINLDSDEEEAWIGILGFTSHTQLKHKGNYNLNDRTYSLAADELIENFAVLLATLGLDWQTQIPAIPSLSEFAAQKILQTCGDASVYSPRLRLDIPFTQWAAFISNEQWRQQLYDVRNRRQAPHSCTDVTCRVSTLSQWFNNIFEAGWQYADALVNPQFGNLVFGMRSSSTSSEEVINGVKLIDLGMQLGQRSVTLLIALCQEVEGKISVLVQLHPTHSNTYLPHNIKLALLDSGTLIQTVQSRSHDYYIQLNRFKGLPGTCFGVQIMLDDFSITEDFII